MPRPNPVPEHFIPVPKVGDGTPVLRGDSGTKDTLIAKARLYSIILATNIYEYMSISQQQLLDLYSSIQYEVNTVFLSAFSCLVLTLLILVLGQCDPGCHSA